MKKPFFFLLIFLPCFLHAQVLIDTLVTTPVGPGMHYLKLRDLSIGCNINVLKIDLTAGNNFLETVNSNDRIPDPTRERTSSMTSRNQSTGHKVVGAVNGDFFAYNPGISIGLQVRNGEFVKAYGGSHGVSLGSGGTLAIGKPRYSGTMYSSTSRTIDGVNMLLSDIQNWYPQLIDNRLVMYNDYFDNTINTGEGETKMTVQPVEAWKINNGRMKGVVEAITTGSVTIPAGKVVFVGIGSGADYINGNIAVGDTIEMEHRVNDEYTGTAQSNDLTQLIGVYPRFVMDGEEYVLQGINELNAGVNYNMRDPRTAIGFNEDSTMAVLVTVDGRSANSAGMNLFELADLMIFLGAHYAGNLDGGGSTTMVLSDSIVNNVSDGSERPIINAVMLVSTAPVGGLDRFAISPDIKRLDPGESYQFHSFGYDQYNHIIVNNPASATYSISGTAGTITAGGLFTAGSTPDTAWVIASYSGYTDSAMVVVKGEGEFAGIEIHPQQAEFYIGESYQFSATGWNEYYEPVDLDTTLLEFSVSGNIGTITTSGFFTAGSDSASGYVIAEYLGFTDSAYVVILQAESISLIPENAVADTLQPLTFIAQVFDHSGNAYQPPANLFDWQVADPTIGTIDSMGVFYGLRSGTTKVRVMLGGLSDSSTVTIEVGNGTVQLDNMESLSGWQITGENIDLQNTTIAVDNSIYSEGSGSIRIDYQYTGSATGLPYLHLRKTFSLYGAPDSLYVDARTDGYDHQVQYILIDDNLEGFGINVKKWANSTSAFDLQPGGIADAYPIVSGSLFYFPARLREIRIKLGGPRQPGLVYNSTLYLDNLRVSYPDSIMAIEDDELPPPDFSLAQNYPNPFNPVTTIKFSLNKAGFVSIIIYDILGREVDKILQDYLQPGSHIVTWNAVSYPSGIYFYRLQSPGNSAVRKMILMK